MTLMQKKKMIKTLTEHRILASVSADSVLMVPWIWALIDDSLFMQEVYIGKPQIFPLTRGETGPTGGLLGKEGGPRDAPTLL